MQTILQLERSCNPTSERLSTLLIPMLTAIDETWRRSVNQDRRIDLRAAHQVLGLLLEQELEQPR